MHQKAFWAVLAGAIMAGSSGVFVKHLHIPATSIAFIRTLIPAALMALWMVLQGTAFFRGNYKLMLGASALNALRLYFFFTAYLYTSIGNAVIISYTWPIFVTVFSMFFLREEVSRRQLWLLGLAFVGILIVYANQPFSFGNRDFIGMSAALGAAIMHAIGVTIFKKETDNYSRPEILFYQNCLGVLVFLPFILFNEPVPTVSDWTIASGHAFFLGIIGFYFFFYGLHYLKASVASALAYVEIVSALLFSVFWMKEELTGNMMLGGAVIVLSTVLLRKRKKTLGPQGASTKT
jgi:drug/metabolite transporter (DMT)-like permease